AKQTSSSDSSLPLHEVLEAEFVALHGELPPGYPSSSEPKARLKALWNAIHGLKEKRAALCISGGGIRSATFGLGILQGLARCGLLEKFHYLSTVSGGGYIGSWLSAWIKNDPNGIRGVVDELKRRPDSTLNPEPRPIRHLRDFSNYLAPKSGLTSVDFWTLITTFIRNMFLNWLVLISWLAAAMMVPRLYLAAINLQPDWSGLATRHSWYLLVSNLPPDWNAWENSVKQPWNIALASILAVGFALIAVAMAYATIDVPSTGNARFTQRLFLKFRQLPLFLASLVLAAWWAVFCNVHGKSGAFQNLQGLLKFVLFFVFTYVCGGALAWLIPSFRKRDHKARPGSVWRFFVIFVTAVFAGFCLWAMATRMFLDHKNIEFTLRRPCRAIQIPSGKETLIRKGTEGEILENVERSYTVETDQVSARVEKKDLDAFELNPGPGPQPDWTRFRLNRACEVIDVSSNKKLTIPGGITGAIKQIGADTYTIETDHVRATIAKKDFDAVELRRPLPAPANHAVAYVCFAPALIMAVVMLVNFLFTGLASW